MGRYRPPGGECGRRASELRRPIGIFEEDGVVAGAVLGELARCLVEGGESARGEEVFGEAVDVVALGDAEGDVVEAGALAVKARGGVAAAVSMSQMDVRPSE